MHGSNRIRQVTRTITDVWTKSLANQLILYSFSLSNFRSKPTDRAVGFQKFQWRTNKPHIVKVMKRSNLCCLLLIIFSKYYCIYLFSRLFFSLFNSRISGEIFHMVSNSFVKRCGTTSSIIQVVAEQVYCCSGSEYYRKHLIHGIV